MDKQIEETTKTFKQLEENSYSHEVAINTILWRVGRLEKLLTESQNRKAGHDADCSIYSALANGRPTDGICTCGYAHQQKFLDGNSIYNYDNWYSKERLGTIARLVKQLADCRRERDEYYDSLAEVRRQLVAEKEIADLFRAMEEQKIEAVRLGGVWSWRRPPCIQWSHGKFFSLTNAVREAIAAGEEEK